MPARDGVRDRKSQGMGEGACILSRTAISFQTGNISSLESRTSTGSYCTCYFVGRQPLVVRNKHTAFKMTFEPSL